MAYVEEDALIREQMEYYRVRAPEYDVTSSPPGDPLAKRQLVGLRVGSGLLGHAICQRRREERPRTPLLWSMN